MTYFLYNCYFIQLLFYTCYFVQFLVDIYTFFSFSAMRGVDCQFTSVSYLSQFTSVSYLIMCLLSTDESRITDTELLSIYQLCILPILPQVFKIWKFQWQVNVSVSALVDFALIINKHLSIEIRYIDILSSISITSEPVLMYQRSHVVCLIQYRIEFWPGSSGSFIIRSCRSRQGGTRGTRLPSDNQLFLESVINTVQPRLCAPIRTRRLAENRVGA